MALLKYKYIMKMRLFQHHYGSHQAGCSTYKQVLQEKSDLGLFLHMIFLCVS